MKGTSKPQIWAHRHRSIFKLSEEQMEQGAKVATTR